MEPTDNQSVEASLRQLRIIHAAMLISILLYAFISARAPAQHGAPPALLFAFGFLAVTMFLAILAVRNRFLTSAASSQQGAAVMLARWRTASIVTWALCEAIALYGLVLRFLGFPLMYGVLFFAAGFLLMLLFAPKRPQQLSRFSE